LTKTMDPLKPTRHSWCSLFTGIRKVDSF